MIKLKSYISMLLVALLLFPLVEKAGHDLDHLDDIHCGIKAMHYCKAEHKCQICNYLFASLSVPPEPQEQLNLFFKPAEKFNRLIERNKYVSPHFSIFLRGPPGML